MSDGDTDPAGVLVVEDDRTLADLYAEWLADSYRVETTYDGETALERLDETIDVVLLDRMLPDRSGDEVLSEIRAAGIDCRVVVVSAVTPGLDTVRMGFDSYLEKPVEPAEISREIERMLTRAEYDERLQRLFSLIERRDTLRAVTDPAVLEESDEYRSLLDELQTARADVESVLTDLSGDELQVAVERLQRTVAERTDSRRYRSLTEDVLDTSREGTIVVDDDGTVVWANAATERLLGLDREGIDGRAYTGVANEQLGHARADDASLATLIERGIEGEAGELDALVEVSGDRERWLEYRSAPIETGLYAGGRIDHYRDVTDRHRYERALESLHSATRELMGAKAHGSVVERLASVPVDRLDFSHAAVFARDRETGDLTPVAAESAADDPPALSEISSAPDPVWTVFTERTELVDGATHRAERRSSTWLDDEFDGWLLCSLGRHGVLLLVPGGGGRSDDRAETLARTWAANGRQSLGRIERSRGLRERDRQLREKADRLSRLDRINRLIRTVVPTVVSAKTRDRIDTEVCSRLARLETVSGAWVADVDRPTGATTVRASAGGLEGYVDVATDDTGTEVGAAGSDGRARATAVGLAPARRAYETGEPVVVDDLLDVDPGHAWRERALARGVQTVVAVPISFDETVVGALAVHAERPAAFGENEVEALSELGVVVGHAIGSIRRRDALLSAGSVELEFAVDATTGLTTVAAVTGTPLTIRDIAYRDDGSVEAFVIADAEDDEDERARTLESIRARTDASVLRDDGGETICRVPLGPNSPLQEIVERGATIDRVEPAGESGTFGVLTTLPRSVEFRTFVDAVTEHEAQVELVAKREQSRERRPAGDPVEHVREALTDRQREVLQTALYMGYFDWPRSADARTVAAELGIAQSTLSQHLRTAERRLTRRLFG